jgi:biotin operon repressor
MEPQKPPDLQVEGWLKTLGVERLCQWDVLVFLYRHLSCLVSGEHIARLLGYPTAEVVTALDALESLGLVERSRVDQGVRLYQFTTPPDSPRGDALGRLLTVATSRAGRLLLAQKLPRGERPDRNDGHSRLDQGGGCPTWRKAI